MTNKNRTECIETFARRNMMLYGTEVNLERAVPDIYDGLKPVQRRVLWGAYQQPRGVFVKSARIVGDVIGKYHPHGDCLDGDTLVYLLSGKLVPIKNLLGDDAKWVLSYDEKTKRFVPAKAHAWRIGQEAETTYVINLSDGTQVEATGNHQFYVQGKGWVRTDELQINDLFITSSVKQVEHITDTLGSSGDVYITHIEKLKHVTKKPMYDFTVDGYANMLICTGRNALGGHTLVLTHNSSTYGAMVTMQQSPEPYILGKGNWGTLVDPPAAHRYTNATLTEYGYSFFERDYINKEVTDFVPNYDDKDIEPVTLPALLPNVLINGATGIGWGITTNTPSFTKESVISALLIILKGKKVSAKELAKTLKPKLKYGGRLVDSPANKANWLKLMTSNSAKIDYEAELTIDEAKKSIIIDNWPPKLNPVTFIDKVRALQGTKSAYNSKGTLTFTIECDRRYNLNQFKEYVNKVQKLTRTSETYKINVTRRTAKVNDGVVSYDNEFLSLSVGKLLVEWLKMRIALEKRSLEFRICKLKERIAYSELLLYATSIRQVIFKSLEQKDSAAYIVKHSKLDLEQAKQILELKVRQLSRLDSLQIKEQLKQQKQELNQLQRWLKKPRNKVYEDLEKLSKKTN